MNACGAGFLTGPCVREKGHEPPHRDKMGCEWRGVTALDFAPVPARCICDLRHRRWNPTTRRCETCDLTYNYVPTR